MSGLRNLVITLALGLIFFIFSERFFWTVWRPEDHLLDYLTGWVMGYSVATYVFLAALYYYKVSGRHALFLAAALYGWIVEGVIAFTLYGTSPSSPFPLSLSSTGLSWHALITVLLGWNGLSIALREKSTLILIRQCVALGIFFGLWSTYPWKETPPQVTPPDEFFAQQLVWTLFLVIAFAVLRSWSLERFRPSRVGMGFSAGILLLFYVGNYTLAGWKSLIILPILLLLVHAGLNRYRNPKSPTVTLLERHRASYPLSRLLWLLLIPHSSFATYAIVHSTPLKIIPWNVGIHLLTMLLGFIYFARSYQLSRHADAR